MIAPASPTAALLARNWPDLDLYHPWDLAVEDAIALGRECEAAALAVDRRLTNSEGATVSRHEGEFAYANTHGFCGGYASSRHGIYCAVIGEDDGAMQRDDWYTAARSPQDLEPAAAVGRIAGERTASRLGARQLSTRECAVVFEAPVATGLIGHYVNATSGGSLYRKSSFLLDSLGEAVFAPQVTIREEPHLARGPASTPFDDEGVATRARDVVRDGVVKGYFLGSYSARKLGLVSTGNAGGNHNLAVTHGSDDLPALLRRMGRGVLVTELLGQGVNPVTGDYSRGAAGYWVEDGGDRLSGRGNHHRGQPAPHVSRHRRHRKRRGSPGLTALRFDSHRRHDGGGKLTVAAAPWSPRGRCGNE